MIREEVGRALSRIYTVHEWYVTHVTAFTAPGSRVTSPSGATAYSQRR
jgi:hypothetical protein